MVMVRKSGKLPGELIEHSYALEYGEARLSIQASRQLHDRRMFLCDDLLASGGTLDAQHGWLISAAAFWPGRSVSSN
jgi:adenine phosphoribosyltransferase